VTFVALILLAVVALLPLGLVLRRDGAGRGRREAALALHRAQLAELERDFAEGRIGAADHATAVLEVQRRLLAADALPEAAVPGTRRWPIVAAMVAVPVAAFALYSLQGRPGLPGAPMAARMVDADREAHQTAMVLAMLRARLAEPGLDPEKARQGYVYLGNAEHSLGHLAEAAAAWRQAVRLRFDPGLAALAAEAQTRVDDGRVSPDSAALFAEALAQAPPDAPWRGIAEQRLKTAGAPAK
jgi:cytochrome c-type biogenesis protein CcmH